MMRLKAGVSLVGMQPELVAALVVIGTSTYGRVVVTSVTEDAAGRVRGSLHKVGYAVDLRPPDGVSAEKFALKVRALLTEEFDVVRSNHGTVHVEFQPK